MIQEPRHQKTHDRPPPTRLESFTINGDRKTFFLDYNENNRGQVLRFTEETQSRHGENRNRRNTVMIPSENLREVHAAIGELLEKFKL